MTYQTRKNPLFSACGLNCGLCPRYHTAGNSKCPGCAGEGFSEKHPPCGVLSCSQRKGVAFCYLCGEFPCKKYDGADASDSFITHQNQFRDFEKAKKDGLDAYETELNGKIEVLRHLLENYDDGRRKSFFCTAINLLDLRDVRAVMEQIAEEAKSAASKKEKASIAVHMFQSLAEQRDVSLTLRKKKP